MIVLNRTHSGVESVSGGRSEPDTDRRIRTSHNPKLDNRLRRDDSQVISLVSNFQILFLMPAQLLAPVRVQRIQYMLSHLDVGVL
jgi:hypothetical protein